MLEVAKVGTGGTNLVDSSFKLGSCLAAGPEDAGIVTEGASADDVALYWAINFFLVPWPILGGIPFISGYCCLSKAALFLCFSWFAAFVLFADCGVGTGPASLGLSLMAE